MKDKKNKNNQTLIMSIIAVALIAALVSGGTYAYWTWVTNETQRTGVSFNIANTTTDLGLSASLEGNGTTAASDLKPTTCTDSTYALKKEVTITSHNETNAAAKATAILSLSTFTLAQNYNATSFNPNSTITVGGSQVKRISLLKWAITSSDTDCNTNVTKTGNFSQLYASASAAIAGTPVSTITFSGKNFSNTQKVLTALEFNVPANTATQTNTFYLWIWLDSSYVHENVGSVNSDPMQGFKIVTQWSGTMANT